MSFCTISITTMIVSLCPILPLLLSLSFFLFRCFSCFHVREQNRTPAFVFIIKELAFLPPPIRDDDDDDGSLDFAPHPSISPHPTHPHSNLHPISSLQSVGRTHQTFLFLCKEELRRVCAHILSKREPSFFIFATNKQNTSLHPTRPFDTTKKEPAKKKKKKHSFDITTSIACLIPTSLSLFLSFPLCPCPHYLLIPFFESFIAIPRISFSTPTHHLPPFPQPWPLVLMDPVRRSGVASDVTIPSLLSTP